MLVRLSAVAVALLLVASGCGGSSRRGAVALYITQVDAVEARLAKPLLDVSKANRDFATGKAGVPAVLGRLRRSDRSIQKLGRRLAVVPAPKEARHLRVLLVQLGDREEALVHEVETLAVFLPAFGKAVAPLAPASTELKRALAAKTKVPPKIAAIEAYRKRLSSVSTVLRGLKPPPSSEPVWSQQLATIARVRSSAEALAAGLRAKRAKAIPKLLHDFDSAAVSNQSLSAQRARVAAVVAYNARIASLDTLGTAIAREEQRLQANVS